MSDVGIRIVIADDHAVVREGIRHILENIAGVTVVGEAESGIEAVTLVERYAPDVIVLDITMPGLSGLEVAARIRDRAPATRILVLSMHDHAEYVLGAIRAGAHGYLLKSAGPAEVRQAIRAVHAGHEYFTSRVAHHLGAALRGEGGRHSGSDPVAVLTPREREVLLRVAGGRTAREIADEFGISHRTVETHRESIMQKLDIRTIAGLARFVVENGLFDE